MEDVAKPLQQKEDVDSARSHNSASSESLNPSDVDKAKRVNAGQRDTLDPANSGNPSEKRPRRSQRQNYPLPCYSIDLPPLDRSKCSKAFYEDLQDRFIIAGFDEERFSCWCHVEKGKKGETDALLSTSHVTHMNGRRHRYRFAAWFHHAERCAFYKVRTLHRADIFRELILVNRILGPSICKANVDIRASLYPNQPERLQVGKRLKKLSW